MKKLLMILLGAFLLTACSSNDGDDQAGTNTQDEETAETPASEGDQPADTEETEENAEAPAEEEKTSEHEAESKYEELAIVFEQIGSEDYSQSVETDNEGKRVILYADENGEKKFKSIYIKHDKRLKIIDLTKDGQIYNETI